MRKTELQFFSVGQMLEFFYCLISQDGDDKK